MNEKASQLREIVERYRALAGEFGRPVALSAFALSREETEKVFSALDEDYHISRFLKFTLNAAQPGDAFSINAFPQSHVAIDRAIETIL
ncbi:MAG: hypothetical protein ACRD5Z_03545 [Bryobacteraceae bacterium]